jgi:hypothetical protein
MSEERIVTTGGLSRVLDASVVDKLARGLRGPLLRRSHDGYDAARKVWNGMIEFDALVRWMASPSRAESTA